LLKSLIVLLPFELKKSTNESFSVKKFVGLLTSQFKIKKFRRAWLARFYGHFDRTSDLIKRNFGAGDVEREGGQFNRKRPRTHLSINLFLLSSNYMCSGGSKGVAETSERRAHAFIIVPRRVAFDLSHRSTIKIFNPHRPRAPTAERTSQNRMQMPLTFLSTPTGMLSRNTSKILPNIVAKLIIR